MRPNLEDFVHSWPLKCNTWTLYKEFRGRPPRSPKHIYYEEKLKELGLVQFGEKRGSRGFLSTCINAWKEAVKRTEPGLVRDVHYQERGNGQKLECRKFHLDTRQDFCSVCVTKHSNRLSRVSERFHQCGKSDEVIFNIVAYYWCMISVVMYISYQLTISHFRHAA